MKVRKRYDETLKQQVEAPDIDAFLEEILAVFRKHDMTLRGVSYEDVEYEVERGVVDTDHIWGASIARWRDHAEERRQLMALAAHPKWKDQT